MICQIKRKQLLLGCIYFDKLAFTLSSDRKNSLTSSKDAIYKSIIQNFEGLQKDEIEILLHLR